MKRILILSLLLVGLGAQAKFNRTKTLRNFQRNVIGLWDINSFGPSNGKQIAITAADITDRIILFQYSVISIGNNQAPLTLERDKIGYLRKDTLFFDVQESDIVARFKNGKLKSDIAIGLENFNNTPVTVNLRRNK